MSFYLNGVNITSQQYNGTSLTQIVYNGTTVWQSVTATWTNIWSGTLFVAPTNEQFTEIQNNIALGQQYGSQTFSAEYSSISDTDITNDTISASATMYVDEWNITTGNSVTNTFDTLAFSSSSSSSNLPYTSSDTDFSATLQKPTSSGGVVAQTADIEWGLNGAYLYLPYFAVTNLYRKDS